MGDITFQGGSCLMYKDVFLMTLFLMIIGVAISMMKILFDRLILSNNLLQDFLSLLPASPWKPGKATPCSKSYDLFVFQQDVK